MSCPRCVEGSFLPGEPSGAIDAEFHGAYYARAPGNETPKRAVLYLTDAFGLPLKNCKIMADELAKRLECDVWVPDYFDGRPIASLDSMVLPDRAGIKISIWKWIYFIITAVIPSIPAIISNRPSVVDKRLELFINLIRSEKKYEKIGVVGFCFGGSTCVRLGGSDLVETVIICHPGPFNMNQVKAMKIPNTWVCAEDDAFFPDMLRHGAEAEFASRKGKENFVEYEFKEYKDTAHGFASRPNLALPEIKAAYEGAFEQMVEWFNKIIPA